jgi:hypothetical protein
MFKDIVLEEDIWAKEGGDNKNTKENCTVQDMEVKKWVSQKACTGKSRNTYRDLVGKPD